MLAVTLLQVAVVLVTASAVVLPLAHAVMEARSLQNADQYRFASQVSRRTAPAPICGELVQTDSNSRISLIVDRIVDSVADVSFEGVGGELSLAS